MVLEINESFIVASDAGNGEEAIQIVEITP